jgi:hypothetical protein
VFLNGAEAAALERTLAKLSSRRGGQIVRARPANIAAALALTRVDVVMVPADDDSPRAA